MFTIALLFSSMSSKAGATIIVSASISFWLLSIALLLLTIALLFSIISFKADAIIIVRSSIFSLFV